MARQPKMTNVLLSYIARDDSAIGVPEEQLDEKYNEYVRTKDMGVLQIDQSKQPCIYSLRTFATQKHSALVNQAIGSLQPVIGDKGEALDAETLDFEVLAGAWEGYDRFAGMAIRDRIIGCTNHPMIQEVTTSGEVKEVNVQWIPGQPEPAGLLDDITGQRDLTREIFQFLVTAASLTDRQKKV